MTEERRKPNKTTLQRMFQSLELLALNSLFLAVELTAGEILPPQDLSVRWITDFEPELFWTPPQHSAQDCTFEVCTQNAEDKCCDCDRGHKESKYRKNLIMEGGFLQWSVATQCNEGKSNTAYYTVSYPELVVNLQCYSYTATQVNCSWSPSGNVADLRFFYWLDNMTGDGEVPELQECSLYTGVGRTGCSLKATTFEGINILFNGTQNNTLIRNTFTKYPMNDVRPSPLKWNVTKSGNKFNIIWTPPEILAQSLWSFRINYTVCEEAKSLTVKESHLETSYVLDRVLHCRYCITIEATSEYGRSSPSDEKCFDAEAANKLLRAMVMIPLGLSCLATLIIVLWWKKWNVIFPKIPQPRDFLTDILDNNNMSTVCNQYDVASEEESCVIVLLDNQDKDSGRQKISDVTSRSS